MRGRLAALAFMIAAAAVLPAAVSPAWAGPAASRPASEPFLLDAGRVLVTLVFRAADGRERPALAWLNMGAPRAALSPGLRRDLGRDPGLDPSPAAEPLRFRLGSVPLELPPEAVAEAVPEIGGEDALVHLFAPRPVEAILPARALLGHRLVLDYPARRIALAPSLASSIPPSPPPSPPPPGAPDPEGVATLIRLDPGTGLAAVDATVGGEAVSLVIDAGAPYTWIRGDVAAGWIAAHPDWVRAEGAVGPSNLGLVDLAFEARGTLLRLPDVAVGPLRLGEVGALGTAPLICRLCDRAIGDLFWDGWAGNAPSGGAGPVAGWLGGDALADFRLTVDYPARTARWLRRRPSGPRFIDQVGIALARRAGLYSVGGVVAKGGRPTVEGAAAGDRILAIDGRDPAGAPSDDVRAALGGAPGARHRLTLDRGGLAVEVEAPVTRF